MRLESAELADCLIRHAVLRQARLALAARSLIAMLRLPSSSLVRTACVHTAGLLHASVRWRAAAKLGLQPASVLAAARLRADACTVVRTLDPVSCQAVRWQAVRLHRRLSAGTRQAVAGVAAGQLAALSCRPETVS